MERPSPLCASFVSCSYPISWTYWFAARVLEFFHAFCKLVPKHIPSLPNGIHPFPPSSPDSVRFVSFGFPPPDTSPCNILTPCLFSIPLLSKLLQGICTRFTIQIWPQRVPISTVKKRQRGCSINYFKAMLTELHHKQKGAAG